MHNRSPEPALATWDWESYFKESKPGQQSLLRVKARHACTLLLGSGTPLREGVVAYGPFVMNSMQEIEQAYRDFQHGQFAPPGE